MAMPNPAISIRAQTVDINNKNENYMRPWNNRVTSLEQLSVAEFSGE